MKVAIIDADLIGQKKHRFPNLVSMKLSGYHKELGDTTELVTEYSQELLSKFDKIYLSKVFIDTEVPEWVLKLDNIEYGGTGFFYDKAPSLPYEVEHHMPDYHLYDAWVQYKLDNGGKRNEYKYYLDYSIGFMTRGCFRQCEFCVNKKYKKVEAHSALDEFLDESRKYICLLDDNILGFGKWKEVFESLQSSGKPFQFKQGLDIRMLNDAKCKALKESKYHGSITFAFDNIEDKEVFIKKAKLLRKYFTKKHNGFMCYVLCAFDRNDKYDDEFWKQDVKDTFERILILAKYGFNPYVMRYEAYKDSPYYGTYVNLTRWCNQTSTFMCNSYEEFCIRNDNYCGGKRTSSTWRYYEQINNDEFAEYIHVNPQDIIIDYWNRGDDYDS